MNKEMNELFHGAVNSAVSERLGMVDFDALCKQVLSDSDGIADALGVDRGLARGFTLSEFLETRSTLTTTIVTQAATGVADARHMADVLTVKYRQTAQDLAAGSVALADQVRSRQTVQVFSVDEFPELADYYGHLKRMESETTEEALAISHRFTGQLLNFARLSYQNELRLIFRQAFIADAQVEALIQCYTKEVPELQLAA